MGKRTSIYLSDDLAAAIEASGLPLAKILWRGLAGSPQLPEPIWAPAARALAEGKIGPLPRQPTVRPESTYEMPPVPVAESSRKPRKAPACEQCPHRIRPGAYCKTCARTV